MSTRLKSGYNTSSSTIMIIQYLLSLLPIHTPLPFPLPPLPPSSPSPLRSFPQCVSDTQCPVLHSGVPGRDQEWAWRGLDGGPKGPAGHQRRWPGRHPRWIIWLWVDSWGLLMMQTEPQHITLLDTIVMWIHLYPTSCHSASILSSLKRPPLWPP